uniref:Uncharacterized protein n=1 Tax=Leersia perrieri TaxID=77586 RepID=A0A0D9X866_9ORYZ
MVGEDFLRPAKHRLKLPLHLFLHLHHAPRRRISIATVVVVSNGMQLVGGDIAVIVVVGRLALRRG